MPKVINAQSCHFPDIFLCLTIKTVLFEAIDVYCVNVVEKLSDDGLLCVW